MQTIKVTRKLSTFDTTAFQKFAKNSPIYKMLFLCIEIFSCTIHSIL